MSRPVCGSPEPTEFRSGPISPVEFRWQGPHGPTAADHIGKPVFKIGLSPVKPAAPVMGDPDFRHRDGTAVSVCALCAMARNTGLDLGNRLVQPVCIDTAQSLKINRLLVGVEVANLL